MYKQFFQGMTIWQLPLFAMLFFFVVFVVVVLRAFLLQRREDLAPVARLPLDEDARPGVPDPERAR